MIVDGLRLGADDFAPVTAAEDSEGFSTGSDGGYWIQVWRRLAANRRAMAALVIIIALMLFTLVGPLVWRVDPAVQSLGLAREGPTMTQSVQVIVTDTWQTVVPIDQPFNPLPAEELPAVPMIEVVEANTERVRLRWTPVVGASEYHIYRHEHAPRDHNDLGVPLGVVKVGHNGFEDGLALKPEPYFYSVVAGDGVNLASTFRAQEVTPERAVGFLQAQLQGLIPVDAAPADFASSQVTLPAHPLGTDALGRDMLARLMYGARTSLFIGIVAPLIAIAFGVFYGAVAGYIGGWIDNGMMRFVEFVIALPFLLFMILLKVAFGIGPGESGVMPMLVAMVLLSWPSSARLVRGQVLQLREQPYVDAARLLGGGSGYLITRHMLPNVLGVVLVALSFAIPSAIFTEAFLSFIGLGVVPPTPSWGSMSNDGMKTLLIYPMGLLWPSVFISITVLSFNLFGDALRDALDIRLERR